MVSMNLQYRKTSSFPSGTLRNAGQNEVRFGGTLAVQIGKRQSEKKGRLLSKRPDGKR